MGVMPDESEIVWEALPFIELPQLLVRFVKQDFYSALDPNIVRSTIFVASFESLVRASDSRVAQETR